jgi:hypothetical protein
LEKQEVDIRANVLKAEREEGGMSVQYKGKELRMKMGDCSEDKGRRGCKVSSITASHFLFLIYCIYCSGIYLDVIRSTIFKAIVKAPL